MHGSPSQKQGTAHLGTAQDFCLAESRRLELHPRPRQVDPVSGVRHS